VPAVEAPASGEAKPAPARRRRTAKTEEAE
jgi:hypothetical protein